MNTARHGRHPAGTPSNAPERPYLRPQTPNVPRMALLPPTIVPDQSTEPHTHTAYEYLPTSAELGIRMTFHPVARATLPGPAEPEPVLAPHHLRVPFVLHQSAAYYTPTAYGYPPRSTEPGT